MTPESTGILITDLTRDEAYRQFVYPDSEGVPTIAIGRNLRDIGVSMPEALLMLANDIDRNETDLDRELPWWRELNDARQRVLMNMAFNLGADSRHPGRDRLLQFRAHSLELIRLGRYSEAAAELMKSKWARQVGPRAIRLTTQLENGA